MCRIFGYIGEQKTTPALLKEVSHRQLHGGPDHQNFIIGENWALGINRLAIQDLAGGLQPFHYNNIYAVFNGEIYNHKELRKSLINRGYTFPDNCDGSIIPALYHEYGTDFIRYLDGMFAIALIDKRAETKLILATDPTGIKSLYYYWNENKKTFYFSSELHSLFAFNDINQELRLQSVDEYLFGRALWGKFTIYKHIYTLPPSTLIISHLNKNPQTLTYASFLDDDMPTANIEEAGMFLNERLEKEISAMLCADVPVCVVTSGGLDSSYLTALASQYNNDLHSFNIWYEGEWPSDERHYASEVSKKYQTTHHQVIIPEKNFPDLIYRTLLHIGQPNSAPHCVSTFALFEAIHESGFKVAITGDGADEFFGGYTRFAKAAADSRENWLSEYLDKMSAVGKTQRNHLYSEEYKNLLKSETTLGEKTFFHLTEQDKNSNNRLQLLLDFDQTDRFPYYILRRLDHLSMAHSIEARVPFCQPRIAALSRKIPNHFKVSDDQVKYILYKAAHKKLPQSIMQRPKQPFTLPITAMLKKGHILFQLLCDTISSQSFRDRNIFNLTHVDHLLQKQLAEPNDKHAEALWSIMTLELWLQITKSKLCIST